ncbi:unnamed protein product, partial [Strongylus vulgaris]
MWQVRLTWNPIYTVFGLPDGSHFWPWSRLFTTPADRVKCIISGGACLFCAAVSSVLFIFEGMRKEKKDEGTVKVMFHFCDYSVYNWFKYYYIPLTFQGLMMVIITYLQHQDDEIEVYENDEWSFVRGQTQTIDRKYGLGIDTIMHHITDGNFLNQPFSE